MSCELESSFIMEGSITYKNEKEISETVSFGIMIDESTNISINKHLVIYVIFPNSSGNIKTHFLQLLALNQNKLVAFASDGASVMIGNKNGLNYFASVEIIIKDVYKFYKNSAKCVNILQEYQRILDFPEIHLKKLKEVRWLDWYDAVKNFVKTLPAVLLQLKTDNSKQNLFFHDIIPMINATIESIQKDYVANTNLDYHLQVFIDHTNLFNNSNQQSNITYYTHIFAYNNCDYDDLLKDVYKYTSIVITEITNHFPDCPLLAAMKILNPVE
ncbi:12057_t:CDS:2 [Cetraspora pellucida]|uniref:12057_t:CDS:1 n=1 Tax=Cetraspora pellucida TaxID=1433469 RepID=A0ACA9MRQ1_9GLOM|nr:12057_t:CDS:2 [Cetraspora pellucida]